MEALFFMVKSTKIILCNLSKPTKLIKIIYTDVEICLI